MTHRRLANMLFALAALTLLLGLALGGGDGRSRIPLPLRMLSSLLVWCAALLLWRGAQGPGRARAARAAAGMGLGFLGDLVMARVIRLPQHILFGMLAFGAGHAQYIRGALLIRGEHGGHGERSAYGRSVQRPNGESEGPALRGLWDARAELLAAAGIGAAGWRMLVYGPQQPPVITYAALAYSLLLSAVPGIGVALARRDPRRTPLALGGTLFLLSDLILAGELFRELSFPHIGDVIWLTYLAGQGLIVYGIDRD